MRTDLCWITLLFHRRLRSGLMWSSSVLRTGPPDLQLPALVHEELHHPHAAQAPSPEALPDGGFQAPGYAHVEEEGDKKPRLTARLEARVAPNVTRIREVLQRRLVLTRKRTFFEASGKNRDLPPGTGRRHMSSTRVHIRVSLAT